MRVARQPAGDALRHGRGLRFRQATPAVLWVLVSVIGDGGQSVCGWGSTWLPHCRVFVGGRLNLFVVQGRGRARRGRGTGRRQPGAGVAPQRRRFAGAAAPRCSCWLAAGGAEPGGGRGLAGVSRRRRGIGWLARWRRRRRCWIGRTRSGAVGAGRGAWSRVWLPGLATPTGGARWSWRACSPACPERQQRINPVRKAPRSRHPRSAGSQAGARR